MPLPRATRSGTARKSKAELVAAIVVQLREHGLVHAHGGPADDQCRHILTGLRSKLPSLGKLCLGTAGDVDTDATSQYCALIELLACGHSCPNSPAVFSYGAAGIVLPVVLQLLALLCDARYEAVSQQIASAAECLLRLAASRSRHAHNATVEGIVALIADLQGEHQGDLLREGKPKPHHAHHDGPSTGPATPRVTVAAATRTPQDTLPCFAALWHTTRADASSGDGGGGGGGDYACDSARPGLVLPAPLPQREAAQATPLPAILLCRHLLHILPRLALPRRERTSGSARAVGVGVGVGVGVALDVRAAAAPCLSVGASTLPWWGAAWLLLGRILQAARAPMPLRRDACTAAALLLCGWRGVRRGAKGAGVWPLGESQARHLLGALCSYLIDEAAQAWQQDPQQPRSLPQSQLQPQPRPQPPQGRGWGWGRRRGASDASAASLLRVLVQRSPGHARVLDDTHTLLLAAVDAIFGDHCACGTEVAGERWCAQGSRELVVALWEAVEALLPMRPGHVYARLRLLLDVTLCLPQLLLPVASRCFGHAVRAHSAILASMHDRGDLWPTCGNDGGPCSTRSAADLNAEMGMGAGALAAAKKRNRASGGADDNNATEPSAQSRCDDTRTPASAAVSAVRALLHAAERATHVCRKPSRASSEKDNNAAPSAVAPLLLAVDVFCALSEPSPQDRRSSAPCPKSVMARVIRAHLVENVHIWLRETCTSTRAGAFTGSAATATRASHKRRRIGSKTQSSGSSQGKRSAPGSAALAVRTVPPHYVVSDTIDVLILSCLKLNGKLSTIRSICDDLLRDTLDAISTGAAENEMTCSTAAMPLGDRGISPRSGNVLEIVSLPLVARQLLLATIIWDEPTMRASAMSLKSPAAAPAQATDCGTAFFQAALAHSSNVCRLHALHLLPALIRNMAKQSVPVQDLLPIFTTRLHTLLSEHEGETSQTKKRRSTSQAHTHTRETLARALVHAIGGIVRVLAVEQSGEEALQFSRPFWSLCAPQHSIAVRVAMLDVVGATMAAVSDLFALDDATRADVFKIVHFITDREPAVRRTIARIVSFFPHVAQPALKEVLGRAHRRHASVSADDSDRAGAGEEFSTASSQARAHNSAVLEALMDALGSLGCSADAPDAELSVGSVLTLIDLWANRPDDPTYESAWWHVRRVCARYRVSFTQYCERNAATMYPRMLGIVLDALGPGGIELLFARVQMADGNDVICGPTASHARVDVSQSLLLSPMDTSSTLPPTAQDASRDVNRSGGKPAVVSRLQFLRRAMPHTLPRFVLRQTNTHLEELAEAYSSASLASQQRDAGKQVDVGSDSVFGSATAATSKSDMLVEYLDSILVQLLLLTKADTTQLQQPLEFLARAIGVGGDGGGGTSEQRLFRFSPNLVVSALAQKLDQPGQFMVVARALRVVAVHTVRDVRDSDGVVDVDAADDDDAKLDMLMRDRFLPMSDRLSSTVDDSAAPMQERHRALRAFELLLRLLGRMDKVPDAKGDPLGDVSGNSTTKRMRLNCKALDPFVPEVLKTLTAALQTSELRRDACCAWATFVALISSKTLEINLPTIVVTMWPIAVEEARDAVHGSIANDGTSGSSAARVGVEESTRSTNAITILNNLVLVRYEQLSPFFARIPRLILPESIASSSSCPPLLKRVCEALEMAVGAVDLIGQLAQLEHLLNNQSRQVRFQAAAQLVAVLKSDNNQSELLKLVIGGDTVGPPQQVSRIVLTLLQRIRSEQDDGIKHECAKALGAIGAVDLPSSNVSSAVEKLGNKAQHSVAHDLDLTDTQLALLVLQKHLVPLLRDAASSSANSTPRVCYAVQELLRFMDRRHAADAATAGPHFDESPSQTLPQWLRKEIGDGAELVEPYWSSSYCWAESSTFGQSVTADDASRKPGRALFHRASSFESWLSSWAKALAKHSSGTQLELFKACIAAVACSTPLAEQLLPYLVRNVLRGCVRTTGSHNGTIASSGPSASLTTAAYAMPNDNVATLDTESPAFNVVHTELIAVLEGNIATGLPQRGSQPEPSSSVMATQAFASSSWLVQRCTQALFALLDTLMEWDKTKEEHLTQLAMSRARSSRSKSKSKSKSDTTAQQGEVLTTVSEDQHAVKALIAMLNSGRYPALLADAACRCKADTRALQYFEKFLRVKYTFTEQGSDTADTLAHMHTTDVWEGGVTVGQLLETDELQRLQRLHAAIEDDPDSGRGLIALRCSGKSRDQPLSLAERIQQHEGACEWSEAQLCYEQLLGGHSATTASGSFYGGGADDGERPGRWQWHTGLIRCHMRQGHLETALHHVEGVRARACAQECPPNKQSSSFGAAAQLIVPHAVEAAWRLGHWSHLSSLLTPVGASTVTGSGTVRNVAKHSQLSAGSMSSAAGTSSASSSVSRANLPGHGYEMRVGELLLALHTRDASRFESIARTARLELAGALAAASSESYARAYPLLVRLHTLHELSDACDVLLGRRTGHGHASATAVPALTEEDILCWMKRVNWDRRLQLVSPTTLLRGDAQLLEVRGAIFRELRLAVSHVGGATLPQEDGRHVLRRSGPESMSSGVASHLAARRVALLEMQHWLSVTRAARALRSFRVASSALLRATAAAEVAALGAAENGLGTELIVEHATLLKEQGRFDRALAMLEPVEVIPKELTRRYVPRPGETPSEAHKEGRWATAKKLLLATTWAQEHGLKQGDEVLERLKAVTDLREKWEDGYFALGQYYDLLFSSACASANDGAAVHGAGTGSATGGIPSGSEHFLCHAMNYYAQSLKHGSRHIARSLPRLLTMWFEWSERLHDATVKRGEQEADAALETPSPQQRRKGRSANARAVAGIAAAAGGAEPSARGGGIFSGGKDKSAAEKLLQQMDIVMRRATQVYVLPYQWYTVLPQLASRICHPSDDVVNKVRQLLITLLRCYPRQAAWALTGICKSVSAERNKRARDIRRKAQELLLEDGKRAQAASLDAMDRLFGDLIKLARAKPPGNERRMSVQLDVRGSRVQRRRGGSSDAGDMKGVLPAPLILPLQSILQVALPHSERDDGVYDPNVDAFPCGTTIDTFYGTADVMHSKEKPKKLTLRASDGRDYAFLCKREDRGDLRKDARVMEFNQVVNRLLQADAEGRRSKLQLRTYAVICLSEDAGLLEWVPNTTGMRHLISKCQRKLARATVRLTPELKQAFEKMQKFDVRDPSSHRRILNMYRRVRRAFPICFHTWFVDAFTTPSAWFDARLAFARSAAVWSMVGYVVGLGDRHGENILIDTESGECVHVDFDCLFDKGLALARPEIVPFRLTPNMLDACGLCGAEGVFRRVCEHTLRVLRENRATLISVLETFVHDPCVEWSSARSSSRSHQQQHGDRTDSEAAKHILRTIDSRLRGMFTPRASPAHQNQARRLAGTSTGQSELHSLPLSINGQADRLIKEASSELNLSQMYIGWMPFL